MPDCLLSILRGSYGCRWGAGQREISVLWALIESKEGTP